MKIVACKDREELRRELDILERGDCLQVDMLAAAADDIAELLSVLNTVGERGADFISLREGIDTREGRGEALFAFCRGLSGLQCRRKRAGIERAKEEGRYKGRKPIAVDETLFDSVVEMWQSGKISAREAMARLNLKPNTFYRRIKEREENKMKDYKKVEHELHAEIKEAARQGRRDLNELKKQVKAEAKGVKKAADEKLELHDVEKEMRKDRIRAEVEHHDSVRQLKKDVQAEAKELKKMMEES